MENKEEWTAFFSDLFPYADIKQGKQYTEITVPPGKWLETAEKIRKNNKISFDYLINLTAVDFTDKMMVVCHLESVSERRVIVLKTFPENYENPQLETLSGIWPTAEFQEREVFDMYGIRFENHPDLRRLFLEEDDGYPLRKDFKDEINIIEWPN